MIMPAISWFLAELQASCPALRSVWRIGESAAAGATLPSREPEMWDLIAFADAPSLQRLRGAQHLHRSDVRLRVVTDGDRFGLAWGEAPDAGTLSQWDWLQVNEREAFYSEAHWREPVEAALVERTRYRARCLWQSTLTS
ncbi:MAG: hypothetical protein ABR570_06585 [Burkholderiales bacterium]